MLLTLVFAAILSLLMVGAWLVEERTGKSGWIDAIWSFSVGIVGVTAVFLAGGGGPLWRSVLVASMVAFWSLRLGSHIALRNLKNGVDPRYSRLKEEWGPQAPLRMFGFLQAQAAAGLVLVLAVYVAAGNPAPGVRFTDVLAAALFAAAIVGEATADEQMRRFARDPTNRGKLNDRGLWSLSRHPNYFFEWLGWLAYPLLAINLSGAHPEWWFALTAPALMYYLLVHVSGIPPLEQHMLQSRGEAFRAYQRQVNAFWPGPRKSQSADVA